MLEIFVICMCAAYKTFGGMHSLVAHRRQNNLSVQSTKTLSDWLGSPCQRFRPGSISNYRVLLIFKLFWVICVFCLLVVLQLWLGCQYQTNE